MRQLSVIRTILVIAATLGAYTPTISNAATAKQRYEIAMQSLANDASLTVSQLTSLCAERYGRACNRAGYLAQKGIGSKQDRALARTYYLTAIEAGHIKSFISLGKLHLEIGEYTNAIEAFEKAANAGLVKGAATLAWAHVTKRLGQFSEQEFGWKTLSKLAQTGQRDAEILLLDAVWRTKDKATSVDAIIEALHARWQDGDAKAAEALSRYFRIVGHSIGTLAVRSALLQTKGLRDKIRIEEELYLAEERYPENFWSRSEELVRDAPRNMFSRALVVTSKIDKNAYVRIVQKELGALGYAVGKPSPYMTRALIRSINSFCLDHVPSNVCRIGPLKSDTIKAVASQLAVLRSGG